MRPQFIRKTIIMLACLLTVTSAMARREIRESSPTGKLKLAISIDRTISYTLSDAQDKALFSQDSLCLKLEKKTLGLNAKLKGSLSREVQRTIRPVVARNASSINAKYKSIVMRFNGFDLEFRLMDNALAYRFIVHQGKAMKVYDEPVCISLAQADRLTAHPQVTGSFHTSCEEFYKHQPATADFRYAILPTLFSNESTDAQLLFGETMVTDYPRMFLTAAGGRLRSAYPKSTLKWEDEGDRGLKETEVAPYIATTTGERSLPWRYAIVTDSKGLLDQNVREMLNDGPRLKDTSWIRPGNVMWDWLNERSAYGPKVNFKTGVNYDTYKYFADFASGYGIKYILLDEGWAKDVRNPVEPIDDVRLPELIKYAHSKGVGVILWLTWRSTEHHPDCFATFEKWGVDGLKIDFMDHSDQWMVNYYERTARLCAEHHLVLDFHGSFTPAGIEALYPNLLSYEGVRGAEQMRGCTIENSLYLPFIRNAAGPMDFTPGFLNSTQPDRYPNPAHTVAMGTRAYQLALYIVYTSGIQMLSDSPSTYEKEPDCTRFMTTTPVTWDESRALFAKAGQYLGIARRKGNKWYVGAVCNEKSAGTYTVKLDFLSPGQHKMKAFVDGANAGREARDYQVVEKTVDSNSTIDIRMVRNGGFAAVIE